MSSLVVTCWLVPLLFIKMSLLRQPLHLPRLALILAALCAVASLDAVDARHVLDIPRTDAPPTIDGKLDDPCWRNAPVARDFRQRTPGDGIPESERTEVRICRDDHALYIAARCFDSNPGGIRASVLQRDFPVRGDDYFFILIDPYLRGREGYYFRTNPVGAKGEGLAAPSLTKPRMDWDTLWETAGRLDALGWTAEFAIPFRSLSFDPDASQWGIDFGRWIARKQERTRWVGVSRNRSWISLEEVGRLDGMQDLDTGKGLDWRPYANARWSEDSTGDALEIDGGFDLFYKLTPNLTATLTYNTDFAETEVDHRRVNLTRFPLLYPEKRDFFLEGSQNFAFATGPLAFHSRRIGLSGGGQKMDIVGGAKITGRQGRLGLGMLGMRLDEFGELGRDDVFVGRFTYDILEESKVGAIFTHGDPHADLDNRMAGFDINLRKTHWYKDRTLSAHGFYMTSQDQLRGNGDVYGGRITFPNYPFNLSARWKRIGEDFEPAMGFVARRGVDNYGAYAHYAFDVPESPWFKDIIFAAEFSRFDRIGGSLQSESHDLTLLRLDTLSGDSITFSHKFGREDLDHAFEIVDGVNIPSGRLDWARWGIKGGTSAKRAVFTGLGASLGDYYDGEAFIAGGDLTWRPSMHGEIRLGSHWTDAQLAGGDFDSLTTTVTVRINPGTKLSFNSLVQYDNQSEGLGLNNRIRYILKPGRDFFLVFNKGYNRIGSRFQSFKTEAITKVGWTLQF